MKRYIALLIAAFIYVSPVHADEDTVTIPRAQLVEMQDLYAQMRQERDDAKLEVARMYSGTTCTGSRT